MVRAALQQVFVQTEVQSAHATWREVAAQLQNRYLPQHSMAETDQTAEVEVIEGLPLSA